MLAVGGLCGRPRDSERRGFTPIQYAGSQSGCRNYCPGREANETSQWSYWCLKISPATPFFEHGMECAPWCCGASDGVMAPHFVAVHTTPSKSTIPVSHASNHLDGALLETLVCLVNIDSPSKSSSRLIRCLVVTFRQVRCVAGMSRLQPLLMFPCQPRLSPPTRASKMARHMIQVALFN